MIYNSSECAVFYRIREKYGAYSNFARGFPITINDIVFETSEALYQAARFPNRPDIQLAILDAPDPKEVKEIAKRYQKLTRPDWINADKSGGFRMEVMQYTLWAKLFCNFGEFAASLLESDDLIIVEKSNQDDFWGAKPQADGTLIGLNHLGLMLTEMRDMLPNLTGEEVLGPLNLTDFKFFDEFPEVIKIGL